MPKLLSVERCGAQEMSPKIIVKPHATPLVRYLLYLKVRHSNPVPVTRYPDTPDPRTS